MLLFTLPAKKSKGGAVISEKQDVVKAMVTSAFSLSPESEGAAVKSAKNEASSESSISGLRGLMGIKKSFVFKTAKQLEDSSAMKRTLSISSSVKDPDMFDSLEESEKMTDNFRDSSESDIVGRPSDDGVYLQSVKVVAQNKFFHSKKSQQVQSWLNKIRQMENTRLDNLYMEKIRSGEVREIDLSHRGLDDDYLLAELMLAMRESTSKVRSLDLRHNFIGRYGAEAIALCLESTDTLESLTLSNTSLDHDSQLIIFQAMSVCSSLRKLDISSCYMRTSACKALAQALSQSSQCKLTHLNVAGNSIGDRGLKVLASALGSSNCRITHLDIGSTPDDLSNNIGPSGAKSLVQALKSRETPSALQELIMNGNPLGVKGAKRISGLLTLSSVSELKNLELDGCKLKNKGVESLAKSFAAVEKVALERLTLRDNKIDSRGAKAVSKVLHQSYGNLTYLDISSNPVDIASASSLYDSLVKKKKAVALHGSGSSPATSVPELPDNESLFMRLTDKFWVNVLKGPRWTSKSEKAAPELYESTSLQAGESLALLRSSSARITARMA